jgi:LacI family repressor for deo operon, udp, cdd, tsx, nupC, and nupG
VLARATQILGEEPYYHEFIESLERVLAPAAASGHAATVELLQAGLRPTAIVYDNDLMALSGLQAARGLGVDVPGELSVVAWDDSALCQLAVPALSAMSHDVERIGELAATAVLGTFEPAGSATVLEAPRARIVARSSTARLVTR